MNTPENRALIACRLGLVGLWVATLIATGCSPAPKVSTLDEVEAFRTAGPVVPTADVNELLRARMPAGPYRVACGDVLDVYMPMVMRAAATGDEIEVPDDHLCRVTDAGCISLPLTGDVIVRDMSLNQVEDVVAASYYPRYLTEPPTVVARVAEHRTQTVSISGGVRKPGTYALRRDEMTLVTLLMKADGIIDDGAAAIRIRRDKPLPSEQPPATAGGTEVRIVNPGNARVWPQETDDGATTVRIQSVDPATGNLRDEAAVVRVFCREQAVADPPVSSDGGWSVQVRYQRPAGVPRGPVRHGETIVQVIDHGSVIQLVPLMDDGTTIARVRRRDTREIIAEVHIRSYGVAVQEHPIMEDGALVVRAEAVWESAVAGDEMRQPFALVESGAEIRIANRSGSVIEDPTFERGEMVVRIVPAEGDPHRRKEADAVVRLLYHEGTVRVDIFRDGQGLRVRIRRRPTGAPPGSVSLGADAVVRVCPGRDGVKVTHEEEDGTDVVRIEGPQAAGPDERPRGGYAEVRVRSYGQTEQEGPEEEADDVLMFQFHLDRPPLDGELVIVPVKGLNIPFADARLREGDTVEVERLSPQYFTVIGLVKLPGALPYPAGESYNLLQALAFAGGVNELADPRYVTVYRQDADGKIVSATFNLHGTRLTDASTVAIRPGDVVAVQQTPRTETRLLIAEVLRIHLGVNAAYLYSYRRPYHGY